MRYSFCDSAQGPLLVAIDQDGLRFVEFVRGEQPVTPMAQWQRMQRSPELLVLAQGPPQGRLRRLAAVLLDEQVEQLLPDRLERFVMGRAGIGRVEREGPVLRRHDELRPGRRDEQGLLRRVLVKAHPAVDRADPPGRRLEPSDLGIRLRLRARPFRHDFHHRAALAHPQPPADSLVARHVKRGNR